MDSAWVILGAQMELADPGLPENQQNFTTDYCAMFQDQSQGHSYHLDKVSRFWNVGNSVDRNLKPASCSLHVVHDAISNSLLLKAS